MDGHVDVEVRFWRGGVEAYCDFFLSPPNLRPKKETILSEVKPFTISQCAKNTRFLASRSKERLS